MILPGASSSVALACPAPIGDHAPVAGVAAHVRGIPSLQRPRLPNIPGAVAFSPPVGHDAGTMTDTGDRPGRDPDSGATGTAGTVPDLAMTTAEAARVAGVSARTIRRWIEKGALPAVTGAGGVLYVFPHDLEAARVASGARPSPVRRDVRDATGTRDDPVDRDVSGSSALSPDPAGEAAGAILTAWRDTVLAPVVEELAATRRELGDARERAGRLEAERDAALAELAALRDAAVARPEAPEATDESESAFRPSVAAWRERTTREVDLDQPSEPAPWWRRWWRGVRGG